MALTPGTRLGPYEVTAQIGVGGMGEVYRARDTKLDRDVAIKVLPDLFAQDPERIARFGREAKTLASLNHPNIAAIYGLEESRSGGSSLARRSSEGAEVADPPIKALVMELVEGPTLADRIAHGAIPIDEALPIAKQIAEALEAAHEQGIIHRDLKPANIKVREDGTVKVLDFGLAKLVHAAGAGPQAAGELSQSPTITSPAMMTGVGMILGTAAYMSPEQAKGREADKRSDIWGFGCVLYEMLSATRAFGGDDISDTLANVLKATPDWNALPHDTPASIRRVLRRCLEKDVRQRLPEIGSVRLEIRDAETATSPDGTPGAAAGGGRERVAWMSAGALAIALAAVLTLWVSWRTAVPPSPLRVNVELGAEGVSLVTAIGTAAVLSPDGQMLAFVAEKSAGAASHLYIRRLEQLQATPLAGTDEASSPFFSPDGQWIAFFAGGKLKKVSVTGGAVVPIGDAPNPRGGSWAEDGGIVFLPGTGGTGNPVSLMRVSSAGGTPEQLIPQEPGTQRWPQVLPGGKAVLYTNYNPRDGAALVVQPLPTGERKVLQPGAGYGRYVPSGRGSPTRAERGRGHLVYIQDATLFAAPFDLDRLEFTGQPVPVIDDVAVAANAAQFAVSDSGTLAYLPGQGTGGGVPIAWMDRDGKTTPLRAAPANWNHPAFAADGRRLAVEIADGLNADVWVYDWASDRRSRLTTDAARDTNPVWTPDDRRIVFSSLRDKNTPYNLYWQPVDGAGGVQRLTESQSVQYAESWHPSGKLLAFTQINPQTGRDVMFLPMDGDETSGWKPGKPTVFLNGPFHEYDLMFSQDGRWLAYVSDQTGRGEVYVRPFSGPGGERLVSTGGGASPTWSRTRSELFFEAPDDRIMVARYTVQGDSFTADTPRRWSETPVMTRDFARSFDLHPDGNRFAVAEAQAGVKRDTVVLIFNFFDELRRLAPPTRP